MQKISAVITAGSVIAGFGLFSLPTQVGAVACPELKAGDRFKVTGNSAVYLLNSENKRMYFPNAEVYNTWYENFSGIVTIDVTCVDAYPAGSGVNYRPGSRLVKSAISPSVYVVGPNNLKHKITDEKVAKALFGADWAKLVRVLPDQFDSNYQLGAPVAEGKLIDGMLVKKNGATHVYIVKNGKLKKIVGTLPASSRGDVRTISDSLFAATSMDSVEAAPNELTSDPTQRGGVNVDTSVKQEDSSTSNDVQESVKEDIPVVNSPAKVVPGNEFTGANYTGPFPAPEGLVLEGYIGSNTFKQPTGSGAYRFVLKTESKRSINCLDSTRTVWKSKGANYDAGFKSGMTYGIKDGNNIFAKYNDTPRGAGNISNKYFAEGFRVAYKHGYEVGDDFGVYYNCQKSQFDLSKYDTDGWRVTTGLSRAPNVKSIAAPEGTPDTGKLDPTGYGWSFILSDSERLEEQELNKGKAPVNLSRIEFVEAVPEGAETSMTMEQVAKMSYDSAVKYTNTKYNRICTLTEPNIETKTYGSNTVTNLSFVQVCEPEAGKITWKLQAYSFLKGKNSGHVLTVTFIDPFDIRKAGTNEYNTEKLPSTDFIAQFLSKIQFN